MTRYAGSHEILRILTLPRGSIRLARVSLSFGLGLSWALCLGVGGGLLASKSGIVSPAPGSASWLASTMFVGGLTLSIAGLFVFMLCVGDSIFPGAARRVTRNLEAALGVAVLVGLACTALTLIL